MSIPSSNNQIKSPQEEPEDFDIQEELRTLWTEADKKYSKNKQLSNELMSMPDRNSVEGLLRQVKKDQDRNLKGRKKSMMRRSGATLIDVAATLSTFLENYSGIADVLKGVDARAGSLVYGGLSILLSASYVLLSII